MLITKSIVAGLTDIGRVRATNEDQYLVADLNKSMTIHSSSLPVDDETELYGGCKGQLVVVADGVSGGPGGQVAGQIGVGVAARYILNTMPWFISLDHRHDDDQDEELRSALVECEKAIVAEVETNPELDGMSTTVTMGYVVWPRLYVVHVGDSRCYLFRRGALIQLTNDHTAAQALVDDGRLTPEQARRSPLGNILIRSLGRGRTALEPDVLRAELEVGDRLLFCTDGLTSQLEDERIAEILGDGDAVDATCQRLVDEANEAGGTDNITVVVLDESPPIERADPRP